MTTFLKHPFKALKAYLPKSLFGRTLLILMAPIVLVETISAYVYFDNHWDHVTKALATNIAGDVATVIALHNDTPDAQTFHNILAGTHLRLIVRFIPGEHVIKPSSPEGKEEFLDAALRKQIFTPYAFTITPKDIVIWAEAKGGVLQFVTPRKRLLSKTFTLFLMWAAGTSAFFLLIAAIFLNNQVKPLRRLAIAADRFGKGRSIPPFKPEGATELRKMAQAFLGMKDRLQRQLTQRTDMLAGVSHDLRTPLTRMRLQLSMMPESAEINGLQNDVEEMSRMLEGYLTFARGEGLEESRDTAMNDLVEGAIRDRALLDVKVHYEASELPIMSVKPQALKRCLTNLINNASRYGKEVWVTASQDKEFFKVSIEDDGPGIPEDKMADVFKPFFRLDPSRNMSTGGVGLGLTIARDVAHSHGGDVLLASSSTHGGLNATLVLPF